MPWVHIRQTEMRENVMFVNQDGILVNFVDLNTMMTQLESVKEYMIRNSMQADSIPPLPSRTWSMSPSSLPSPSLPPPSPQLESPTPIEPPTSPIHPVELFTSPSVALAADSLPNPAALSEDAVDSFFFLDSILPTVNTLTKVLAAPIPKMLQNFTAAPKKARRRITVSLIKGYAKMLLPIIRQIMRDACAGCRLQLTMHDNCVFDVTHVSSFLNDALDVLNEDYADSFMMKLRHVNPTLPPCLPKAIFKTSKAQRKRLIDFITKLM